MARHHWLNARVMSFDYTLDFTQTDFRAQPELYRVGRGEQGVLSVEPYKSEILPHWRFKTPEIAQKSADAIYDLYTRYKADGDFVGMDMARKFLQMGYTRARRYTNHRGGRKYDPDTGVVLPYDFDAEKAEAAEVFRVRWRQVREDEDYLRLKRQHRELYEPSPESRSIEVGEPEKKAAKRGARKPRAKAK